MRDFDRRAFVLGGLGVFSFAAVGARLVQVQVLNHGFWADRREVRTRATAVLPARRGAILSRGGVPLAVSAQPVGVAADPHAIDYRRKIRLAGELSAMFGRPEHEYLRRLEVCRNAVLIEEDIASEDRRRFLDARREGGMRGAYLIRIDRRIYPQGDLAAQVVGSVRHPKIPGREGLGPTGPAVPTAGVELMLDERLRERRGLFASRCNAHGSLLGRLGAVARHPVDGQNARLALDAGLQRFVEEVLEDRRRVEGADSAMALVLDAESGDLLGVANLPKGSGQFNNWEGAQMSNRVFAETREFGSVMKPIWLAIGLEEGAISADDRFWCGETLAYGGRRYRDYRTVNESLEPASIIFRSSNVGAIQALDRIVAAIGRERLVRRLADFGFGRRSNIGFPGESRGMGRPADGWGERTTASLAMGYGLGLTALQLARAYSVFLTGGRLVEPRLVLDDAAEDGPATAAVLSAETACLVAGALRRVVSDQQGTAHRALGGLAGIDLAGKTGTSNLLETRTVNGRPRRTYFRGRNNATFVGFVDHRFIVLIHLEAPTVHRTGGGAAAPVFGEVARHLHDRHAGESHA